MADCSKTVDFNAEQSRMCDYYEFCNNGCPFKAREETHFRFCGDFVKSYTDEAVAMLQKWSDEHPLPPSKTYADVFFEQHPKATRLENGRPRAYRCEVYGCECKYKCPPDVIESTFNTDRDPCKICWNEPYPEQEASNE